MEYQMVLRQEDLSKVFRTFSSFQVQIEGQFYDTLTGEEFLNFS